MFKKVLIFLILAAGLGAFLFLRNYFNKPVPEPALEDRLPPSDFLGRVYLLELSRETSAMMFYNKLPFRDMLSYDFILSKAKGFGLDVQRPAYLFADEDGNWGAMIEVNDSSRVYSGIQGLKKNLHVSDSLYGSQPVYRLEDDSLYLAYGEHWMLFYSGEGFADKLQYIVNAHKGSIDPAWKAFLAETRFKDESLVLYSNWDKFRENGIETALFAHNSDSVSVTLLAYIRNSEPWNFKPKDAGWSIVPNSATDRMINLHLDISGLRGKPDDVLYRYLSKLGKKISFPTDEFIAAWDGDLSFRMGGTQKVEQQYIESVMDENFEITEVTRTQMIDVPAFSVLFSLNENGDRFINKLFAKGILTHDGTKYRFLYSPPLYMKKRQNYYIFHSGEKQPEVVKTSASNGMWTNNGTRFDFQLDSLTNRELFGRVSFPVQHIVNSVTR